MRLLYIILVLTAALSRPIFAIGNSGDSVVVVYNSDMPESKSVADHYAECRQVPANQVIGLKLPTTEAITRTQYNDQLESPLLRELEDKKLFVYSDGHLQAPPIRCV